MYRKIIILAIVSLYIMVGCGIAEEGDKSTEGAPNNTVTEQISDTEKHEDSQDSSVPVEEDTQEKVVPEGTEETEESKSVEPSSQITEPQKQVDEITAEDLKLPADFDPNGIVVVIDAGHQGKGNSGKEPDGPGSSTLKAKVSSGATGCVTKQKEYVLNLEVSLKLRDELKSRGYQVVMIREDHAINISNSERAKFANSLNADAFLRIHANSSDNSSVQGVETICQTASNPYNANLYADSRKLSDCILDAFVESTGAKKRRVWETDTMSGINWCEVPVTIVEMGFLSNPEEDRLMASEDYQNKMVQGIADGLDEYFNR